MANILVLNGPNVNLIGTYKTEIFGSVKLSDIENQLKTTAKKHGHEIIALQSNAENILVDTVQKIKEQDVVQFMILNPGGLAYTSVALRDAIAAMALPFIEVHLSNLYKRESFRRNSYFADIAVGQIVGLGPISYELALIYAIDFLKNK